MPRSNSRSLVLAIAGLFCIDSGHTVEPPAGGMDARPAPATTAGGTASAAVQTLRPEVIASQGNLNLELPPFLPGMWEYRRTQITSTGGKPQTATVRKCGDPTAEFKRKMAELKHRGCLFTPLKKNGPHYEASWRCSAPDGTVLAMRNLITVNSDSSYQNESEAFVSQQATRSIIVANRQGDCPAPSLPIVPSQPKSK
jgi:hypothetical protein